MSGDGRVPERGRIYQGGAAEPSLSTSREAGVEKFTLGMQRRGGEEKKEKPSGEVQGLAFYPIPGVQRQGEWDFEQLGLVGDIPTRSGVGIRCS